MESAAACADVLGHPRRPWDMAAVGNVQVFHLVEGVRLGEIERDRPIPDRAANGEHLVRHYRRLLHRVARGLHGEGREIADCHQAQVSCASKRRMVTS